MNREIRQLAARCEKRGAVITFRRNGHMAISIPGGGVVNCSATPGDSQRVIKNIMADLRRNGLDLKERK